MKRRRDSRMKSFKMLLQLAVVLMMVVMDVATASDNQCPVECSCLGSTVICENLQLVGAPNGLPPWTENLILKGNNFANLEFSALLNLPRLQELDVNSNLLGDNFTLSLSEETQLKWLKVNKNRLTRVPELPLPHLTHLALSHNMINAVNESSLVSYPELLTLDLSNNKLTHLRNGSFVSPKMKSLNLNANQISQIEANTFTGLTSLTELKLTKNHLTSVKHYLEKFKNLKSLDLSRNELKFIEALAFNGLQSLEKLRLKRNKIEALNDGAFWPLNNLLELGLDYNLLTSVPKGGLFGMNKLKILTMTHNKIAGIENLAWDEVKELTDLDLSYNEISRIENLSFSHASKLKRLILNNNKISSIAEGAFTAMTSLEVLEMNFNKISYIVEDALGMFVPLTQLQRLGLAHNQIKSIHQNAFNGLSKLTEIDLVGNNITSIQENAFSPMASSLTNLKMNSSELFCDCSLQWLSGWLRANRFSDTRVKCGYPHWLRGQSVTHLHHANFTCEDFPKPRIIEEPEVKMSTKGDNVTLRCRATSTSDAPLSFTWKRDNTVLQDRSLQSDSDSIYTEGTTLATSELNLVNISSAQAGRYQCMVSNSYGTTYSAKVKLSVFVYPSFTKRPKDITVNIGSTAKLECSAQGLPNPQISWQKDGGNDFPAARERRMHKMPTDDMLFIVNVKLTDSGVYSCIAKSIAGSITANATITVIETPTFVKPMEDKEVIAGGSIVLECMAGGSPRPQLSWSKNGSPLLATERHFFTAENQLLIIVNTEQSDAGSYECEINNSLGKKRGASILSVKEESSSVFSEEDLVSMVLLTVVMCAVTTSIVWVIIIYHTRRRLQKKVNKHAEEGKIPTIITIVNNSDGPQPPPEHETHLYLETSSQHSKDSGTGDSTNPSNDQLQLCVTEVTVCAVSNEEESENVEEGGDPLLRYTNHERQVYGVQVHRPEAEELYEEALALKEREPEFLNSSHQTCSSFKSK